MAINKPRNQPSEILLNNYLDEDFQNMLLPLQVMQTTFFNPKFIIQYNFVTPNQLLQKSIALIGFIFYMALYMFRFYKPYYRKQGFSNFLDLMFYAVGFGINCICSILQSESNINLIIILYDIYYQLRIKIKSRNFALWNWMYFILIFLVYFFNVFYFLRFEMSTYMVIHCMCLVMLMSIDINAIYAIRILDLIKTEQEIWNIELESFDATKTKLINYEISNYWNKMFKVYENIQEGFIIYKKVCQTQILFFVGESFFHALIYLSVVLEYGRLETQKPGPPLVFSIISISIWVMKNLMLLSLLSRGCENLYLGMNKAEYICAKMLNQGGCHGARRIMCKNIRRLNKSLDYKFSVLSFFVIDAKFPQIFMSGLATYVIVLLQFEFKQ